MKKIFVLFLLLFSVGVVQPLSAFELRGAEELEINEVINDDLYSAGGRTEVTADINGDIVAAGWEIVLDGNVSQDAILAGGEIVISKPVGDDVRVAGWDVSIRADVLGDVIVFAGDVHIDKDVTIHGDLVAFAGNIKHEWVVKGDLRLKGGRLSLAGTIEGNADIEVDTFSAAAWSGAVLGTLNYTHNEKLSKLEALAKGEINFELEVDDEKWEDEIMWVAIGYIIMKLISVFVFASIIYFFFEKVFISAASKLKAAPGKSALYGFLLIIWMPVVAVLLMITVIGIPFGILTLVMYIFMLFFVKLFNVMMFTAFMHNKYNFDSVWKKLAVIFGFTLLFCLASIVSILAACFTLGALMMQKVEIINDARK